MSEYIKEGYIRVTEILSIFQNYSSIPVKKLIVAQELGTHIHDAIEAYFNDKFAPIAPKAEGHWQAFLKWYEDYHKPIPELVEKRLYQEGLKITGKLDLMANIGEKLCLVDFKTGSWSHPDIWRLQMTFYCILLEANELPIPDYLIIVQLAKDGSYTQFMWPFEPLLMGTCTEAVGLYKYFDIAKNLGTSHNP